MSDDIIRHRSVSGIILEGASGVSDSAWTDVLNRLATVEYVAETTNPYIPPAGTYITTESHGLGGAQVSGQIFAQSVIFTPLFVPQGFTTQWIGAEVTTAQPGADLHLGLYNRSQTLLAHASVAATTAGIKLGQFASPVSVSAGFHWLGVHCNNVSGVQIRVLAEGMALYFQPGAWMHVRGHSGTVAYGPMPPMTAATAPWGAAPLLFLEVGT